MKDYIQMIENLLIQGKTTGENHSVEMLHYTKMNLKRLERWLSKGELTEETKRTIRQISEEQHWIVLTEAWCGDAAHSLGFIQKIADENPLIKLEWKLRDQNPGLMDSYLTNGGRSIPKLIVRDKKGNDLFDWGPRPKHIQKRFLELKEQKAPYPEISIELQKLYNQDKGAAIQKEISAKISATL